MNITITNKHLTRAIKAEASKKSLWIPRGRYCLVAQAVSESIPTFSHCFWDRFVTEDSKESVLPQKVRKLVSLFDEKQDVKIKSLLPVTFAVRLKA